MAEPVSPDIVTTAVSGRREAVATECLDDMAALAFVEGSCSPEERSAIVEHVSECEGCRELVSGLLHTDTSDDAARSNDDGPAIPGEQVGPYRFGPMIAEGGMGRIYKATETKLGRDVAIKVPRTLDPGLMLRFDREVAITARLQHPGIVPIHGAGVLPDGTPFYVMRFIEGIGLHELVARARNLGERIELVKHLVSVADTMAYVHAEQVVHRDLKPNNVLVGKFGETLIIDWGLAKDLREPGTSAAGGAVRAATSPGNRGALDSDPPFTSSDMTRAGDILGTPAFMPPEQATGLRVDVRADVFALGCILRYLLTGKLALPVADHGNTFEGVPPALVAVHDRATAIERDERYADAGEFATALRTAIAPPPPVAVPRPKWHWAVPLLGLGGIAFGVTLYATRSDSSSDAQPAPARARTELIDQEPPGTRAIAISPSGKRVGYGGLDRLEVRDLTTKQTWTRPDWMQWPGIVTFESDDVVIYSVVDQEKGQSRRIRWDLRTRAAEPAGTGGETNGGWFGQVAGGDIVMPKLSSPGLVIMRDGARHEVTTFGYRAVEHVAVAPGRQRFALIDHRSPSTRSLRVVDAEGKSFVSPPITDLGALTWLDDETLLYAVGTRDGSTLYRVTATPDGLVRPVQLYEDRVSGTWIGGLAAARGRIVMSVVESVFETHLFGMDAHADERLDPMSAAAPLGWRDDGSYLAWNRSTQAIEIRTFARGALPTVTPAIIHGDPANVTRANDVLIVAIRDERGRRLEAVSLTDGKQLWSTQPGALTFVRCANDAAPPCIAGKVASSGRVELRRIDPVTGAVGDLVIDGDDIADAALDATGTTLAWVTNFAGVHVRALAATGAGTELSRLSGVHSVAFAPEGGVLATTFFESARQIVRLHDGEVHVVVRTGGNIVSMVRPSSSGDHLLYRTRTLTSNLVELHLGAP